MQRKILDEFISDVREILQKETSIGRILERIHGVVRDVARSRDWHHQLPYADPRGTAIELYVDPDHLFWVTYGPVQPGHRFPPHDHGELGWAVYGVLEGEVVHKIYHRNDDGGAVDRAEIELGTVVHVASGDAVVIPPGGIHEVVNDSPNVAWQFVIRSRRQADIWYGVYDIATSSVKKIKRTA